MPKVTAPEQGKFHKHIVRDRFLGSFEQPSRFRVEWEKVKQLIRGKGHEQR